MNLNKKYMKMSKQDLLNYVPSDIVLLANYFDINPNQPIHLLIDAISNRR